MEAEDDRILVNAMKRHYYHNRVRRRGADPGIGYPIKGP